jgi:hypothetical protein
MMANFLLILYVVLFVLFPDFYYLFDNYESNWRFVVVDILLNSALIYCLVVVQLNEDSVKKYLAVYASMVFFAISLFVNVFIIVGIYEIVATASFVALVALGVYLCLFKFVIYLGVLYALMIEEKE